MKRGTFRFIENLTLGLGTGTETTVVSNFVTQSLDLYVILIENNNDSQCTVTEWDSDDFKIPTTEIRGFKPLVTRLVMEVQVSQGGHPEGPLPFLPHGKVIKSRCLFSLTVLFRFLLSWNGHNVSFSPRLRLLCSSSFKFSKRE